MQRQSLGSPASKLQIHVAKEQKLEGAENRKGEEDEGEDKKGDNKLFKSTSRTHKSIHLIPLLIISCFLILYLVSHDPSQKDLVTIGGFEGISLQKGLPRRLWMLEQRQEMVAEEEQKKEAVTVGDYAPIHLNDSPKAASGENSSKPPPAQGLIL